MLPQGGSIGAASADIRQQPSRTYAISGNRITGMIDGLDAVKQAVFKALQTNRFEHLIYSGNYGNELNAGIGLNPAATQSIVTRRIKEALLPDERIRSIEGVQIEANGDSMTVSFTVVSQYGTFQTGVNLNNV